MLHSKGPKRIDLSGLYLILGVREGRRRWEREGRVRMGWDPWVQGGSGVGWEDTALGLISLNKDNSIGNILLATVLYSIIIGVMKTRRKIGQMGSTTCQRSGDWQTTSLELLHVCP